VSLASKLSAVEDAVKTLLVARSADPASALHVAQGRGMTGQVPVDVGPPAAIMPEHVFTAPENRAERQPATTGNLGATFTEEFVLPVRIAVQVGGTDNAAFLAARDRADDIAADIETAWAGQAVPGAAGILDAWVAVVERQAGTYAEDSIQIYLAMELRCTAYLGPG